MVSYRSVPAHDELHRDGESLVLLDGQVQRVSALGTAIRRLALPTATLGELAAALEQEFGAPPAGDLLAVTRQAADDLVAAGLLERVEA